MPTVSFPADFILYNKDTESIESCLQLQLQYSSYICPNPYSNSNLRNLRNLRETSNPDNQYYQCPENQ
jgi:hypothetical protein